MSPSTKARILAEALPYIRAYHGKTLVIRFGGAAMTDPVLKAGFARDVVTASVIGAGPLADAFVVAFRLPNHFRTIFGEGAFNAAYVPSYARVLEPEGAEEATRSRKPA